MLQAAAALIVEKGWEATTAADIGRRAGYSRAMVHARFGSKDAILEAFLHEYVRHLNPDPDPNTSGMQQVLAHFDRIEEIYAEDHELLLAMFVATFEAVKTTSPLRHRVRDQLKSGAVKVREGLRNGIQDGSVRPMSTSTGRSRTSPQRCSASPSGGTSCPRPTISMDELNCSSRTVSFASYGSLACSLTPRRNRSDAAGRRQRTDARHGCPGASTTRHPTVRAIVGRVRASPSGRAKRPR